MGQVRIYKGMGLRSEQIERLNTLDNISDSDIIFDDDCPQLTDAQLAKFERVNPLHEYEGMAAKN